MATELIGRALAGFPGYFATEEGHIVSTRSSPPRQLAERWKVCNTTRYKAVQLQVSGVSRTVLVHRLVCTAFNGERPYGMVCRHVDGDTGNNMPTNLVWGTPKQNTADIKAHGRSPTKWRGPLGGAKLTPDLVRALRADLRDGLTHEMACAKYGISMGQVSRIRNNQSWGWIDEPEALARLVVAVAAAKGAK